MNVYRIFILVVFFQLTTTSILNGDVIEDSKDHQTMPDCAITYSLNRGRFGDHLFSYLHAKWLSYKYKLPFIYLPFPFSEKLAMHDLEPLHIDEWSGYFSEHLIYKNDMDIMSLPSKSLIIVPFFLECMWYIERKPEQYASIYFAVDWKDLEFRAIINKFVAPKEQLELVHPPQDRISVAIHLRDGGDYDHEKGKKIIP